jgi:serine/threonine protein kinase
VEPADNPDPNETTEEARIAPHATMPIDGPPAMPERHPTPDSSATDATLVAPTNMLPDTDHDETIAGSLTGSVIGSYFVSARIGRGGFGEVYRAEQAEPVRRSVAIKILRPGINGSQWHRQDL